MEVPLKFRNFTVSDMARVLAIDYGLKRTGLAVTDELQIFAFGLQTVVTHDLERFLKTYVVENGIAGIVVGEPKRLNNEPTDATAAINLFVNKLGKLFPEIPVYRIDERFTSSMASKAILASGIKKQERRNKALVDEVSATIILQSWLEQKELRNGNTR